MRNLINFRGNLFNYINNKPVSQAPSNRFLFSSSLSTLSVGGSRGTLKQSNLLLSFMSWMSSVTKVDSVHTASEWTLKRGIYYFIYF